MHRGRRWAFNLLTDFSVILALGVAGAWVASYWRGIGFVESDSAATRYRCIYAARGRVVLGHNPVYVGQYPIYTDQFVLDPDFAWSRCRVGHEYPGLIECKSNWIGFGWGDRYVIPMVPDRFFAIPHWFLLLLAAALPAIRLVRFIRRRLRAIPGHCAACGYDLRATPDRCPECGRPASGGPRLVDR